MYFFAFDWQKQTQHQSDFHAVRKSYFQRPPTAENYFFYNDQIHYKSKYHLQVSGHYFHNNKIYYYMVFSYSVLYYRVGYSPYFPKSIIAILTNEKEIFL